MPLVYATMQEREASATEAPALFSAAALPSENEVTITTSAIHSPSLSSMQDYRPARHISFAPVVIEFDIPIPPEFCKYEPLGINHAPI
jgi:hypothetical protein